MLAALALAADSEPDAELLRRFADAGDDRAFAALVRRFGPMVLGVCRRVARDEHAAEDAFQAAFVVLARRAADVREGAVRGWLYGVAVRCANGVRAMQARQRAREAPVAEVPERAAEPHDPPDADALAALDEAIGALPEHLRAAVVLCELDGVSRADAATRLGIAEGTLSSRLAKARKLLARALQKRGLAVPAAGLAVLGTAAPVSARLAAATSALFHTDTLPPVVAALTGKVVRAMLVQKLKLAGLLAALAIGIAAGVTLAVPTSEPEPETVPIRAPVPQGEPKALVKGPNRFLLWRDGGLVLADPDGKTETDLTPDRALLYDQRSALSPTGEWVATRVSRAIELGGTPKKRRWETTVHLIDPRAPGEGTDLGADYGKMVWSPDGTELLCHQFVKDAADEITGMRTVIVNVKTKERTALNFPRGHVVTDWTRDGKFLTTVSSGPDPMAQKYRMFLVNRDGTVHKALAPDTNAMYGRASPDGTRVLCELLVLAPETPEQKQKREAAGYFPPRIETLAVLDLATGRLVRVGHTPQNLALEGFCWSPDGKKIAYTGREKLEGEPEERQNREAESYLIVCDPDGTNAKKVISIMAKDQWHIVLGGVDWR